MITRLKLPRHTAGQAIGLFGGSFNPAHSGHLHVAKTGLKRLGLSCVWWIVARGNPLKSEHGDFDDRLASARKMARGPRMIVTDLEREAGLTYTIDLITTLQRAAPEVQFVWLMGSDSLASFHRWKDWQAIARHLPIAVIARPGAGARARFSPFARRFTPARLPQGEVRRLASSALPAWVWLAAPLDATSSTALRARSRP